MFEEFSYKGVSEINTFAKINRKILKSLTVEQENKIITEINKIKSNNSLDSIHIMIYYLQKIGI